MSNGDLTEERKYMRIRPIGDGIVIDHLLQYTGLFILNLLDQPDLTVTAGRNYDSTHLTKLAKELAGRESEELMKKDIIYMEGANLTQDQRGAIRIVSPTATLNYIRGGQVVQKVEEIPVPETIGNILLCATKGCTTNKEGGVRQFRVIEAPSIADVLKYTTNFQERTPFKVQCCYCEQVFFGPMIRFYTGQTLQDILEGKGRFLSRRDR